MYKSTFLNMEYLIESSVDDEYDIMLRLYSLIIRLNLDDPPLDWEQDQWLIDTLDDYVQRCRIIDGGTYGQFTNRY